MSEEEVKTPLAGPGSSSTTITALATALSKAQGEIENAGKDASNPFFKSKYSDLAGVVNACKAPLAKNGLSVIQLPSVKDECFVTITTILAHESGEWIKGSITLKGLPQPRKQGPPIITPQSIGSAITYGRRYALMAMIGIASEDDDGNDAAGNQGQGQQQDYSQEGGPAPAQPRQPAPPPPKVNEQQLTLMWETMAKCRWEEKHMKAVILKRWKLESCEALNKQQYNVLCEMIIKFPRKADEEVPAPQPADPEPPMPESEPAAPEDWQPPPEEPGPEGEPA